MALRGTLDNLGLAGVFQLIAQNNRHGVLTIEHEAEQLNLWFAQGQLVRTEGTFLGHQDLLGTRLVRAGLLTAAQLQAARAAQDGPVARLRGALLAQKWVDEATLETFELLHSREAVFTAFGWLAGSYAFLPALSPPAGDHGGIKADHLLMEALSALDAWPAVQLKVPHMHAVYQVDRSLEDYLASQALGQVSASQPAFADPFSLTDDADAASVVPAAQGLSHADRLIYGLVDGVRDVQALIDRSALGTHQAMAALAGLLDAQLVKRSVAAPAPILAAGPPAAPRPTVPLYRRRRASLWPVLAQSAYLVAALACVWLGARPGAPVYHLGFTDQVSCRVRWQHEGPAVMHAVEVVRAQDGSYPNALDGLIGPQAITPFYAPVGAGYLLRRPWAP